MCWFAHKWFTSAAFLLVKCAKSKALRFLSSYRSAHTMWLCILSLISDLWKGWQSNEKDLAESENIYIQAQIWIQKTQEDWPGRISYRWPSQWRYCYYYSAVRKKTSSTEISFAKPTVRKHIGLPHPTCFDMSADSSLHSKFCLMKHNNWWRP